MLGVAAGLALGEELFKSDKVGEGLSGPHWIGGHEGGVWLTSVSPLKKLSIRSSLALLAAMCLSSF